jgi:hypothetical protein
MSFIKRRNKMNFADYTSLLNEGDNVLSSDDISLMASLERACRNLSASMDEKICKLRACQRNLASLEMRLEARRLDIERERKEVKKVRTNERTTKKSAPQSIDSLLSSMSQEDLQKVLSILESHNLAKC